MAQKGGWDVPNGSEFVALVVVIEVKIFFNFNHLIVYKILAFV